MTSLTPRQLDRALAQGHLEEVKASLVTGWDLNQPLVRYGMLPLHNAAWHGHTALVALLLNHGADPEGRSDDGLSALLLACEQAHWTTATLLLTLGAKADTCDNGHNQAIHFAAERAGGEQLLDLLMTLGVSAEACNVHGSTPLHVAAKSGQTAMVNQLARVGVDLNARDQEGYSPLLLAARERRIDALWALHELKADETVRNHLGEGLGDIVDPLLFEQLGRDHDVYWWLRPLMPVQKRYQAELRPEEPVTPERAPERLRSGRSSP